jgi:hypothetical protein
MEIILLGPEDTSFNPHTNGRQPLEDWLKMHFQIVGPFADEQAARAWIEEKQFDDDRYWSINAVTGQDAA